ncbi:MAG: hypothetical protein AB7I98_21450 [Verrucomicrobiales bacterium]
MNAKSLLLFGMCAVLSSGGFAVAQDGGTVAPEAPSPAADGESGKKAKADRDQGSTGAGPLESMSPEEKAALRKAFEKVWADPEVVQARHEISRATEAYQKALHEALSQVDPKLAATVERMRKANPDGLRERFRGKNPDLGGPPPGSPGSPGIPGGRPGLRGGLDMLTTPGFLGKLEEPQRKLFLETSEKARKDPRVEKVLGKLQKTRESEDSLREERIKIYKELRRSYYDVMMELEPGLKAFVPPTVMDPPKPPDKPGDKGAPGPGSPIKP